MPSLDLRREGVEEDGNASKIISDESKTPLCQVEVPVSVLSRENDDLPALRERDAFLNCESFAFQSRLVVTESVSDYSIALRMNDTSRKKKEEDDRPVYAAAISYVRGRGNKKKKKTKPAIRDRKPNNVVPSTCRDRSVNQ